MALAVKSLFMVRVSQRISFLTGDFSRYDYKLIYNQPWSRYDSKVVNYFLELNHEFSEALQIRAGASRQDYERDRYDNQTRGLPAADGDIRLRARHRINRWDYSTYFADLIAEFATGPVTHQLLIGMDKTESSCGFSCRADGGVRLTRPGIDRRRPGSRRRC